MASYRVEVTDQVSKEIRRLPGNMRQRIIRILQELQQEPRPNNSRLLDMSKAGVKLEAGAELHRLRVASWRVVYLIEEEFKLVSVLAIRRRPPYRYEDLAELVRDIE